MSIIWACLVPTKVRTGCQIHWKRSYRWLCGTMWDLGILLSALREQRVLLTAETSLQLLSLLLNVGIHSVSEQIPMAWDSTFLFVLRQGLMQPCPASTSRVPSVNTVLAMGILRASCRLNKFSTN